MDYHPERANRPFPFRGVPYALALRGLIDAMDEALKNYDSVSDLAARNQHAREIVGLAEAFVYKVTQIIRQQSQYDESQAKPFLNNSQRVVFNQSKAKCDLVEHSCKVFLEATDKAAQDVMLRYNTIETCRSIEKDFKSVRLPPSLTHVLNNTIITRNFPQKIDAHFGIEESSNDRLLLPAQTGGPYPEMTAIAVKSVGQQESHWVLSMIKDYQAMIDNLEKYYRGADTSKAVLSHALSMSDQASLFKDFCDDKLIMPQLEVDRQNLEIAINAAKTTNALSFLDHRLAVVHKSAKTMFETFMQIDFSFDIYRPKAVAAQGAFSSPEARRVMEEAIDEDIASDRISDQFQQSVRSDRSINTFKRLGVALAFFTAAAASFFVGRASQSSQDIKGAFPPVVVPADALGLGPGLTPP
jgi:hypothetical protein